MILFLQYYVVSGFILMVIVHFKYDFIIKTIPFISVIDKQILMYIQFFTGFFQLPIIILLTPLVIYNKWKIKQLKEKIKKQEELNAKLKEFFTNLK